METRGADLIIPYNVGHNVRKTNKARIYWYVRSRNIRSSLKMIKKKKKTKNINVNPQHLTNSSFGTIKGKTTILVLPSPLGEFVLK